jgi:hypothetical protein
MKTQQRKKKIEKKMKEIKSTFDYKAWLREVERVR